ncbi:hypothetical protein M5362_02625 [Streptomyces sp. Je 1-79]|uniref:hypothetical protein n=1 Tax=Streptomyces sp. Je 1-79 TaxID=2943847 RepID=UPI0021A7DD7B|nr:hypothetical protein [Streptomyces sp. Je 1-79]MCT4352032.1 hypothetical protein [Streptomyces sp. Je 1-79]
MVRLGAPRGRLRQGEELDERPVRESEASINAALCASSSGANSSRASASPSRTAASSPSSSSPAATFSHHQGSRTRISSASATVSPSKDAYPSEDA